MSFQYRIPPQEHPSAQEESQQWTQQLETYFAPYRERLDAYLDRRVVGNLSATVARIMKSHADPTKSILGGGICGVAHTLCGNPTRATRIAPQGMELPPH